MTVDKLSPKQQLFVHEYLVDMNATQAAIRAGFSKKTAYSQGSRLLKNVEVQKALDEAWREKIRRADITADDVLRLITRAAYARLDDFVDWKQREDGDDLGLRLKDPDELGVDTELISEITEDVREFPTGMKERTRKIKLVNKEAMIRLLATHFGLTETKVKLDVTTSLADVLAQAWALERGGDNGDSSSGS